MLWYSQGGTFQQTLDEIYQENNLPKVKFPQATIMRLTAGTNNQKMANSSMLEHYDIDLMRHQEQNQNEIED